MLLSNRQRKYMSLLLCLLMIFAMFTWNVQQVHANPVVVVAGKYVAAGILAGMGYVATTSEGQEAIGQFVYDNCSVSTRDKLTAIAGMIAVGSQQAIKLSESLFSELSGLVQPNVDAGIFTNNMYSSMDEALVMAILTAPVVNGKIVISNNNGTFRLTIDMQDIGNGGSSGFNGPYVPVSAVKSGTSLLFTYSHQGYYYYSYTEPAGQRTIEFPYFPWGSDGLLVNDVPVSLSTSIPLDSTYEPKNSVPPPFWLPINDMGTITLPTSQDALYEGVQGVVAEDMPFEVQESLGSIQGDVGAIKGILGGIGAILGNIFNKFLELLGSVGSIGQVLSNIWNKILEILASMVAFFQAILDWVTSFFSELALTIEAVLTEFFTIPAPFVLPTDMFDGMLDDLLDKTGLSAFDQTFSRLQNLQTGYGSPPEITINLHELMAATSHVGNGFSVPLANKESLVIDFAKLQEVEFWNMSLIDLIRALLSLSMVGMTFNYIYRKIIPDKVIE